MKFFHPVLGVSFAIGLILFVFAYLCTSTEPLLAASSVAPSSICGQTGSASQRLADIPDATHANRMARTIRPTLRSPNRSFACSPPGTVLADNCYPSGSFCNQDRQCCSGVCNKDGGAWGHCQ